VIPRLRADLGAAVLQLWQKVITAEAR